MSPLLRRLFLFSLFLTFASLALIIVDLTMGVRVPVVRPYLPYGLAVGMLVMLTIYVGHVGKPQDPRKRGEVESEVQSSDTEGGDGSAGDEPAGEAAEPPSRA